VQFCLKHALADSFVKQRAIKGTSSEAHKLSCTEDVERSLALCAVVVKFFVRDSSFLVTGQHPTTLGKEMCLSREVVVRKSQRTTTTSLAEEAKTFFFWKMVSSVFKAGARHSVDSTESR